ncbi:uncharacterized protein TNCV_5119921 [Trichonephila clavipes]|nr:uncharacterized protein TNCV_5119921 [Trichonephila clavipes]
MDVCKCIVPARHWGTLNSRRAASPLVRLVEGEERWEASDHPRCVLPLNWGGIKPNRTVTCMVLKATANDRRHLTRCHDEFRGPRSGLCRSDRKPLTVSSGGGWRVTKGLPIIRTSGTVTRRIASTSAQDRSSARWYRRTTTTHLAAVSWRKISRPTAVLQRLVSGAFL